MYDKKGILSETKSYTGISDIFGPTPFHNVLYRNPKKTNKEQSVTEETIAESDIKSILKNSILVNETPYVTCEKYHGLNKNLSYRSIVRSTSTIFCDLDDIAKRHSFNCLTEISMSNANILKVMKMPTNNHGFKGHSTAIVQECATQIHPKLLVRDSLDINTKKAKKSFPHNDILSSEIFLKDYGKHYRKNQYYNIDISNNHQKFWSYAKYRTEYTKPIPEDKRAEKKERGKRTEDPCPCQLFSYACPCTDEKSLTELAKNSKCLTVNDQITSTTIICHEKKKKHDTVREDKPTNTYVNKKDEIVNPLNKPIIQVAEKHDIPVLADANHSKHTFKTKCRPHKKTRQVVCPNCKEKIDVSSTTEEEESLKLDDSIAYRSREITPAYNCSTTSKSNRFRTSEDGEVCNHDPRCELVPVCQILPEDVFVNPKGSKKHTSTKSNPRVIRITKACRHHPPCTVVPSCQRANVLRNNCEYIPPCLHRPRCVNLPLCVPFSKSINYDDPCKHDEENLECAHASQCQHVPVSRPDSVGSNVNRLYNMVTRVQNACEYINGYRTVPFAMNPNMSPTQISTSPCCSCRSNKSCQYECSECKKCISSQIVRGSASSDAIIFIRDVGCQFQNKIDSHKDSLLHSKTSSASFDLVDVKTGNYYTAVHTLRCEDKFTNPKSGVESISTDSTSLEVDSHCPSHGRRSMNRCTGFDPSQRYVTAYSKSDKNPSAENKDLSKSDVTRHRDHTFPVKSRRSFSKRKYSKTFSAKQRRKSANKHQYFKED